MGSSLHPAGTPRRLGRRYRQRSLGLLLLVALLAAWQGHADAAQPGLGTMIANGGPAAAERAPLAALGTLLASPSALSAEIDGATLASLRDFYAGQDYLPLWVGPQGLQPNGQALRQRLTRAQSAGQPAAGPLLAAIESRLGGGAQPAELELLLSAALLKAAVDPGAPDTFGGWSEALEAAASTESVASFLQETLPVDPAFWRLRRAVPAYGAIEAAGGWPTVPEGPKLELGESGPRVELLDRRLRATGDLTADRPQADSFDGALDAAVRRFQTRHGLLVDGIVGRNTLAALDVPVQQRLATIKVNLFRLLGQRRDWGERYVAVNTAAPNYRVVEAGRTVIERPAIVGKPSWPTPQLDSVIDRLEFNPYWTVPPRILRLELMPQIRKDPNYLAKHDMHWVNGMLRQDPGPNNPLGEVKFLFPNPYSVYLHDTNNRQLFERPRRFFSHGCMRIAGAMEFARFLLKNDPDWPAERIDEAVASGQNVKVQLKTGIPLHVVYDTAWVDEQGVVNFRDDVYKRDRFVGWQANAAPQLAAQRCPSQNPRS